MNEPTSLKEQLLEEARSRCGVMATAKSRQQFDEAFDEFWNKVEAYFEAKSDEFPPMNEPSPTPETDASMKRLGTTLAVDAGTSCSLEYRLSTALTTIAAKDEELARVTKERNEARQELGNTVERFQDIRRHDLAVTQCVDTMVAQLHNAGFQTFDKMNTDLTASRQSEARLREKNISLKTALLKVHDLATWSSDNPVTDALANRIVEVTLPFFTPTNTDTKQPPIVQGGFSVKPNAKGGSGDK